jgi:adenylate cyclase
MGTEIERKFLLADEGWREGAQGTLFRQGYLSTNPERSVRVRTKGETAFLTIKGPTEGVSRLEFEYEIPLEDARHLLDVLCERPLIEKTRYTVTFEELVWEIDDFHGINAGLVIAEVELESEDKEFEKPPWLGEEVSDDSRYYNTSLVKFPFKSW